MNTTAIVDIVCAVFMGILYARFFTTRSLSKSSRILSICLAVMTVSLLVDVSAYTLIGPEYPVPFRFLINFCCFEATCVNVILFTFYEEALFSERCEINSWFFRIIKAVELVWAFATAYEFISGHLITYSESGMENLDYSFPAYITVLNLGIQIYLLVITAVNSRRIGREIAHLLCLFFAAPIITSILFSFIGMDFAYAFGAVMLGLVTEFIQKKQTQKIKEEQQKLLEDTLFRQKTRLEQIKGLAGQFAVLYFVNLDTLETENYYLENSVTPDEALEIDKKSENFFEAFRSSMVVYAHPDYREDLLRYAEPEYIRNILKDRRRHDFRFLCMDASGDYSWTDMVVMKFSDNENDYPVNIAVLLFQPMHSKKMLTGHSQQV